MSQYLLAVDIGLHTGLAFFSSDQKLLWYRSHHLPTAAKLKIMIGKLLRQNPRPDYLYLEGGGLLADLWIKEAARLGIQTASFKLKHGAANYFTNANIATAARPKKKLIRLPAWSSVPWVIKNQPRSDMTPPKRF